MVPVGLRLHYLIKRVPSYPMRSYMVPSYPASKKLGVRWDTIDLLWDFLWGQDGTAQTAPSQHTVNQWRPILPQICTFLKKHFLINFRRKKYQFLSSLNEKSGLEVIF